jgi:putative heme-binding domain-containing protein
MVGVAPGTSPLAGATPGGRGSATRLGDPARGRAVFNGKGGCVTCHHAENTGGTTGPDLSATGTTRGSGPFSVPPDPAALEQSILDPNADIAAAFRMFQVTLKSGAAVRGTLLNQDTFSVQIRDDAQNLRGFLKSDLKDFAFLPSAMPSYRGRLTSEEVADVVSYLLTLKGQAQ